MRPHRTLLFRLTVLDGGLLLVLGVVVVLLLREAVHDVTREFHDRNATLFRSSLEHIRSIWSPRHA